MKVIRLVFLASITFFSLFLGFRAGLLTSSTLERGLASPESGASLGRLIEPSTQQEIKQFNLLVVGVNDRSNNTRLLSTWLLGYHQNNPNRLTLIPLFPAQNDATGELNTLLTNIFELTSTRKISPAYLETLQSIYMISWDGYLILDMTDVQQGIETLGGIQMGGVTMQPSDLGDYMDQISDDPDYGAQGQAVLIANGCKQLAGGVSGDHLLNFAELAARKLAGSLNDPSINAANLKNMILNPILECDFPTLSGN